ncbi:MAG: IPT/TIG domain-containing protein, partial [Acidobacteriota bacterium]
NGDEVVSTGTVRVAPTAPSIFTANANGSGAPAGLTGRLNANSQFSFDPNPPFAPDPVNPGTLIPSPVDVGTATQPAFLILYGTGIRNAVQSGVSAVIGGVVTSVEYAGPAPNFTGLDQVNIKLPVSLRGSGIVDVTVVVDGVSSNSITINLAGTASSTLAVSGFNAQSPVLAGETITISGSGFSATAGQNIVRFGSAQARIVAATPNELTVIVPFGAESGQVVVQTNNSEARSSSVFLVKTSISGMVQSTGSASSNPVALNNVTVRLSGTNLSVRTNPQGTFVLSDIPAGVSLLEVDGGTTGSSPPYPSVTLKIAVRADRDNQVTQPISLQQINGGSGNVGTTMATSSGEAITSMVGATVEAERSGEGLLSRQLAIRDQAAPQVGSTSISNRGVALEVPLTTTVKFPDGTLRGSVQVTMIERSRLPGIQLPTGVFSTNIAQITPIGVVFSPGASITFPNPDPNSIGAGAKIDIYRYDANSGSFIKRGTGTVTADKLQVASDGRIVDTGGFWMAAVSGRVTTVTGRLIDSYGDPVAGGKVTANGRAAISDQNGGFSLPDVPAINGSSIQAEAVVPQQYGNPPRGLSAETLSTRAGVTDVGTIALSETNQPGLVLSPFALNLGLTAKPTTITVTLTEPASTRGLPISLTSSNESVVKIQSNVTIPAGKTTASFNITPGSPGTSLIAAKASLGGVTIEGASMVTVTQPGPTLSNVTPSSAAEGGVISIFGSGLAPIAIRNYVTFSRNGVVLTYLAPSDIRIIRDGLGQPALSVRVPKIGPGPVTIQVAVVDGGNGVPSEPSAPIGFTVIQKTIPAPKLAGLTPTEGSPRDEVTINGSGFNGNPKLNLVNFIPAGQTGASQLTFEAEVRRASSSSLVAIVPPTGLPLGKMKVVVRVLDEAGVESADSNALDFTVVNDTVEPPLNPTISRIINRTTGTDSGREGDQLLVTGSNFGLGWFNPNTESISARNNVITILRFYQSNRFINSALPIVEGNGMTLTAVIPSGLQKGITQVAAINYDQETGKSSNESKQVTFQITEGTPLRLRETEPNNSINQATQIIFPSLIEGDIASGESGEIVYVAPNGEKLPISDLYRLNVTARVGALLDLSFINEADLDLFIYRKNTQGAYELLGA